VHPGQEEYPEVFTPKDEVTALGGNLLKRILTPLAALAVLIGMAGPASAATASPGEWTGVGNVAVINDGGVNALRIHNDAGASYAYTSVFAALLTGSKSNSNITVCATYRVNNAGWPEAPTVSNGVWSVTLPTTFSNIYQTKCDTVFNSSSQPFGGAVSVVPDSGGSQAYSLLLKNVTIN
jgi:hypothetical protein